MWISMRKCLLLISVLFFSVVCQAQALQAQSVQSQKYSVSIDMDRAHITGICVLRDTGDEVVGSLINEFGIKAFDFVYDKRKDKTKLKNVIKMLNKWYIKKVLCTDLSVLFREKNNSKQLRKRRLSCEDAIVELENIKYNITYKFQSINAIE